MTKIMIISPNFIGKNKIIRHEHNMSLSNIFSEVAGIGSVRLICLLSKKGTFDKFGSLLMSQFYLLGFGAQLDF